MLFLSPQVFFSMLEIYNEQVTEDEVIFYLSVSDFSVDNQHSWLPNLYMFNFLLSSLDDQVLDLLSRGSRTQGGLRVREEQQRGFYVEGLRTVPCDSAPQVRAGRIKWNISAHKWSCFHNLSAVNS